MQLSSHFDCTKLLFVQSKKSKLDQLNFDVVCQVYSIHKYRLFHYLCTIQGRHHPPSAQLQMLQSCRHLNLGMMMKMLQWKDVYPLEEWREIGKRINNISFRCPFLLACYEFGNGLKVCFIPWCQKVGSEMKYYNKICFSKQLFSPLCSHQQ